MLDYPPCFQLVLERHFLQTRLPAQVLRKRAALKLMRKLLKTQGFVPSAVVTDKLPSYGAALGVVTLSEIGTIWTINQQAKPLKTLASKLAVVGEFH